MATQIHLISKQDVTKHTTISLNLTYPPLPPSSVRVRTRLIGITANNFTYASLGGILHWWDTWPVPAAAPAPYNDPKVWGIVPAWGFGEVVETNVEGIAEGAWLWGYWLTSSHLVDLQFEARAPTGHYVETSTHRQKLMRVYNRYELMQGAPPEDFRAWKANVYPLWASAYVLIRYNFASTPDKLVAIDSGPWTAQDADLSSSIVVVLSASSKTGRSAVWNLADREQGQGPLAVLQVTTDAEQRLPGNKRAAFESRIVSYGDLTTSDTLSWVSGHTPLRIVVLNIGSPSGTVQHLHTAIQQYLPPTTGFTFVGIGSQARAISPEAFLAEMAANAKLGLRQFNASDAREAGEAFEGPKAFYEITDGAFQRWLDEGGNDGMELSWGEGIAGLDGVENAWEDLCKGKLTRAKAKVFRLP